MATAAHTRHFARRKHNRMQPYKVLSIIAFPLEDAARKSQLKDSGLRSVQDAANFPSCQNRDFGMKWGGLAPMPLGKGNYFESIGSFI